MTSTVDTDWTTHARRLADTLHANGDLRSPQWHAAVSAVPRHLIVPRAYQQDNTGSWIEFETATALERVYSPETLVTALETVGVHRLPISSSTKPDLMVRMLEILDVHDGHRVLEIGTGSGYNAALLAHRLGGDRVFSIDVGDDLVDLARRRLHTAGLHPTLMVGDGVHGLVQYAPFDRIIVTCSVPAVPWEWAEQLAPGGTILVDFKLANSAGNLVHLHRVGDRLRRHLHHPVGRVHGYALRPNARTPRSRGANPRWTQPVHRRACRSMERGQDGMVPRAIPTTHGHIDRLRPRP